MTPQYFLHTEGGFRHGSLFSGIGGFDYAAQQMGWENVFHCEWNQFGQKLLQYYWPNAISYGDITKTDFSVHRGTIDILTGGFPCQPYSVAGLRKGTEDDRHLWPEMLRAIREIQPRWVVGENVPGLINWNDGMVFEEVQADLEAEGYEVQPFVLPAAGVNAPHKRERIWFVAYAKSNGDRRRLSGLERPNDKEREPEERGKNCSGTWNNGQIRTSANANSNGHGSNDEPRETGRQEGEGESIRDKRERFRDDNRRNGSKRDASDSDSQQRPEGRLRQAGNDKGAFFGNGNSQASWRTWNNFPTQSPVCAGDDGLSARLDGITFSKWRNESIKAAGNAIVPQVVLQIFKAIAEFEKEIRRYT